MLITSTDSDDTDNVEDDEDDSGCDEKGGDNDSTSPA